MSSIVRMYDASNNDAYPITHLRAVRDSNGTTLESMIQGVNETTVGYYECTTAGSTPEKTITIDSSVSLSVKISCKVKFAEKNTGANATMNINNTGAKPLFYNGVRAAANNSWYPNEIVDLYFDGTNYQAKSCADTLEYDVSLHQTHEITEVTTTTRTVVYNGDVTSGWENETSVSDSSVNGYTRTETNTGKDNDTTTVDGPTANYDSAANKTSVVYVTKRTLTHVVNDYTFDEAVNAVPMSYRHGGLKLRFISNSNGSLQNSDNKYVQYRLMANEWSTTVSDWQGVDDEPVEGSDNLVKSGGVSASINKLKNAGYLYAGIATPSTNPGTPDGSVFYIANGKGTYTNFSGIEVTEDEVVVLYWDTAWHKVSTGIASNEKLTELEGKIAHGNKKGVPIEFVQNGYLYETGEIATSSSSKVTGFIEIDQRNNYYLSNCINGTYDNGVCYYADADETTFIGRQFNKNDVGEGNVVFYGKLNIPATAKYIRIGTRSINNPNVVAFIVEEAEVSASVSSVNEIREASYKQENILNALYPFITDVNAENILDKNKVGDYDYAYISSSLKIIKNTNNALFSIIVKIDDYDGVNKTYIYKYFGEKSAADMGVNSFYLFLANEIVDGESIIDFQHNTTEMRGYSINTDKSSAYLYFQFVESAYDYDNAMSAIHYILDNLVVIKQEGTTIAYPTEYIPHTDKKIDFSIGPVPADLTADDSVSGVVSLGMVDKNGNLVGNGVTFNVGQGGGGELAVDQLNVITSLTYHLQPSMLTSQSAILGTGWAGSLESGYTHTAGNTSPLEFPLSEMSAKARLLITFDVQGLSESNDVYISAGDSVLIKSYNGGTAIVTGLIYDGGNLKVTPTSNFAGTITNLKCRKLDDNGSETYTTEVHNVYCQRNSLVAGYWNVFIGSKTHTASKMQDGTRNIAIGYSALDAMSVGNRNVAIGTFAMPFVTEGENNIAIGSDSIYPVTKAMDSVSIGKGTMGGKSVEGCVALGAGAMGVWDDTIERFGCTSIGTNSAPAIVTGNTHVGYRAGVNTNGAYNTSIGYNSLGIGTRSSVDIVGTNLTCVGHNASVANNETAKAANNSTALGYGATITKSNQVVIGNNAVDEVVIGGKKIIFNEDGSVTWTTL